MELRDKQGLAYSVGAFSLDDPVQGAFGIHAATDPVHTEAIKGGLDRYVLAIVRPRARAYLLLGLTFQNFPGKSEIIPSTPSDRNLSISATSLTVQTKVRTPSCLAFATKSGVKSSF